MLRRSKWVAQRPDPTDEDCISFALSRLDSGRSSLAEVCKTWRKARLQVERGDPRALATWRNLSLGEPAESGAADVDKLHAQRQERFALVGLEQVCAGIDVQDDRVVVVVLGFDAGNRNVWVLDHEDIQGDPRDDVVWEAVDARLRQPFGGLPVTVVSADAGYLTATVRGQCQRRRWWLPGVGRSGRGAPDQDAPLHRLDTLFRRHVERETVREPLGTGLSRE